MLEKIPLSDEHHQLLLDVAAALGLTANEMANARYECRNPAWAHGYVQGFLDNAKEEHALLACLVLSMLRTRLNAPNT